MSSIWSAAVKNMTEKLTALDPAEHLNSEQAIASFMEDAFKSGGPACIAQSLGVAARAGA